jgi:hypothetical protein
MSFYAQSPALGKRSMNTSLIAAVVLMLGSAGQAFADGVCPVRSTGEDSKALQSRVHDYCEVKWNAMVGTPAAARQTHDHYITVCERRCYGDLGALTAGKALTVMTAAAGIGLVAYSAGQASDKSNNSPASP